jgi:hypothetical protein
MIIIYSGVIMKCGLFILLKSWTNQEVIMNSDTPIDALYQKGLISFFNLIEAPVKIIFNILCIYGIYCTDGMWQALIIGVMMIQLAPFVN